DDKDQLQWKWTKGAATTLGELGDPLTTEDYYLCIYDAGALISSSRIAAGGTCDEKPCWKASATGYQYKSKTLPLDGITQVKLKSGISGKAQMQVKGKGVDLEIPPLGTALS